MNDTSVSFHLLATVFPSSSTVPKSIKDKYEIYLFHKEYSLSLLLVLCTLTTGMPGPVLKTRKNRGSIGWLVLGISVNNKE